MTKLKLSNLIVPAVLAFAISLGIGLASSVQAEGENSGNGSETSAEKTEEKKDESTAEKKNTSTFGDVDKNAPEALIQLSPVSRQVILENGKTGYYDVTVTNSGSEEFTYELYAAPYSVTNDEDDDYVVSFTNETTRTQVSRWISFLKDGEYVKDPTYKIKPGESQKVSFRIEVPENIPDGGQYAAIFAQTEAANLNPDTSGVRTVSRVAMIIYGRTNGNTIEKASITSFKIPGFMIGGNITVESKIINEGNTDFDASIFFKVESLFGEELYKSTTAVTLLPETERKVKVSWDKTPFMGIFRVTQQVTAFDEYQPDTKTVIIFPIYMMILTIIVLTSLIVWIIITVKKRKERKARLAV